MKNKFSIATVLFFLLQLQFASAQSWQKKYSGLETNRGIIEMAAPDQRNCYATTYDVIDYQGNFQHVVTFTHNGGSTWQAQTIAGLENHWIDGLAASSANTVFALGWNFSGDGSAGGKVYRSTNGGYTWTQVATNAFTNPGSFPDVIAFFNSHDGVMLGDPVNGSFEIYITHNGGNSWTQVSSSHIPAPLANEYGATFFFDKSGNTIWCATYVLNADYSPAGTGRLLQSDNKGASWYVRNSSLPENLGFGSIKFRNHSVGLYKDNGSLYRTTNGGTTWNVVNHTGTFFHFDFDNVPGKPGWWISTGGDASLPENTINGYGSSITYDDGDHWVLIDTAIDHTCVEMTGRKNGYTGGLTTGSGNDGVFVYSPFSHPANPQVISFTLIDAANDVESGALNDGAVIDLAQGPMNVRANLSSNTGVGSVRFKLNGNEYRIENVAPYAIAGDNPTGDYHEWHLSPGTYTITAIPYSGSNGSGTAGVARSVTFTIINSGAAKDDVAENMNSTIESNEMMLQVYPNPSFESFTISVNAPIEKFGFIRVFDMQGKIVLSQRFIPAGIFRFGKDLAPGVYVAEITVGSEKQTMKLVKQ